MGGDGGCLVVLGGDGWCWVVLVCGGRNLVDRNHWVSNVLTWVGRRLSLLKMFKYQDILQTD